MATGKHARAMLSPSLPAAIICALALALVLAPAQAAWADEPQQTDAAVGAELASGAAQQEKPATPTIEERLAKVNLKVRAKLKGASWQAPVKAGKTAGKKGKKAITGLKISLTGLNGVSGSIRYKLYSSKNAWTAAKKNGQAASAGKKAAKAVRIWLKGTLARYYDVYYRVYTKDYGWLGWASDGQVAGTTKLDVSFGALQVKLVKKGTKFKGKTDTYRLANRWQALEYKYFDDEDVQTILEVKHQGGSKAQVVLREKGKSKWKTIVSCGGYVGRNGVGKTREGLSRTPEGDYGITSAFGIKSDPGAILPYVKVSSSMYWCGDRSYYNRLIDINDHPHECLGEHLIDYSPHYDYGLFFDYNTNPVRYGAGSAFFVHCTGSAPYTAGCIAVSKSNMIKIIRNVEPDSRICIYRK